MQDRNTDAYLGGAVAAVVPPGDFFHVAPASSRLSCLEEVVHGGASMHAELCS